MARQRRSAFVRAACVALVPITLLAACGDDDDAGSAPTTAQEGATDKSEIVIGTYGSTSGPLAAVFKNHQDGLKAWVEDVNARGGLNGHPVKWIVKDDGGDPGQALATVREMVEDDGVVAFYGSFGVLTQQAITPYLEQKRIPVIQPSPVSTVATSPMMFRTLCMTKCVGRAMLASLVLGAPEVKKVSVMYQREAAAAVQVVAEEIKSYGEKVGIEVVSEHLVSIAAPDHTAEILAARDAGAEALMLIFDTASIQAARSAADRADYDPVIVGPFNTYELRLEGQGPLMDGYLTSSTSAPFSVSDKMKPYRDALEKYVPDGQPSTSGADMWVGGQIFEKIAESFGDTVTSEDIVNALLEIEDETFGGLQAPVTIEDGPHERITFCTVPMKIESEKFVPILDPDGLTFACAKDDGTISKTKF